jgi:hypothetical protein
MKVDALWHDEHENGGMCQMVQCDIQANYQCFELENTQITMLIKSLLILTYFVRWNAYSWCLGGLVRIVEQ